MSENDPETNNQSIISDLDDTGTIQTNNDPKLIDQSQNLDSYPKWINNKGEEVKQVFGFNEKPVISAPSMLKKIHNQLPLKPV